MGPTTRSCGNLGWVGLHMRIHACRAHFGTAKNCARHGKGLPARHGRRAERTPERVRCHAGQFGQVDCFRPNPFCTLAEGRTCFGREHERDAFLARCSLQDRYHRRRERTHGLAGLRSLKSKASVLEIHLAPFQGGDLLARPGAAPLIVGGLARVWAAKMVAAESWRFPPLGLQWALEFTRAFSGAIVQQANSR